MVEGKELRGAGNGGASSLPLDDSMSGSTAGSLVRGDLHTICAQHCYAYTSEVQSMLLSVASVSSSCKG